MVNLKRYVVAAALVVAHLSLASGANAEGCGTPEEAYAQQRLLVQDRLRAPTTAEFSPWWKTRIKNAAECEIWWANGYVDAQNGFGAQIRTRYVVKMRRHSWGSWEIIDLVFDQ